MGGTLLWLGELIPAQKHFDQALALYKVEQHGGLAYHLGQDPGSWVPGFATANLWCRGYPDQALTLVQIVLSSAQIFSHPFSLAATLGYAAFVRLFRREGKEAYAHAEASSILTEEHGFAEWSVYSSNLQGWALVEHAAQTGAREQREAGITRLQEGLAAFGATGEQLWVPFFSVRWLWDTSETARQVKD